MSKHILQVVFPLHIDSHFDYCIPKSSQVPNIGTRVLAPFRGSRKIGIVTGVEHTSTCPASKLKEIIAILGEEPLFSEQMLYLCKWASEYYHHPLGEVVFAAVPNLFKKTNFDAQTNDLFYKRTDLLPPKLSQNQKHCYESLETPASTYKLLRKGISTRTIQALTDKDIITPTDMPQPLHIHQALILNDEQQHAFETIKKLEAFSVFLLNGITGSGKTEIYLQLIANLLQKGLSALVLVPEIGLTPQTIARFESRFNTDIVAFHSGLSEKERLYAWKMVQKGHAKIAIGTRSAVFAPIKNLGMIIIDEEHDSSFKQQDGFHYSARDLAILRAKNENIPVVLGSATPSLETLYNVKSKRYEEIKLVKRAGDAAIPQFGIIDLKGQNISAGISQSLENAIEKHIQANNQVLLFINRRGYAKVMVCPSCGFGLMCSRCSVHMIYHKNKNRLQCHHCHGQKQVPSSCPNCHQSTLKPLGLGTQKVQEWLEARFQCPIIRIDRDSTRKKGAFDDILKQCHQNKPCIIVGTQMIAKGHHLPHVTLVGVIGADYGLYSSDFHALEKLGQLLVQVAGRAGRAHKKGEVLIQTYNPTHPALTRLFHQGYLDFAEALLEERQQAMLPPYSYQTLIEAEGFSMEHAFQALNRLKAKLKNQHSIEVYGPMAATMEKKKGKYKAQLVLQSNHRPYLKKCFNYQKDILELVSNCKLHVIADPSEF